MSDRTVPTPPAVAMFRAAHLPTAIFEALLVQDDVERELPRLRPLVCIEDQGDYETLLGRHAAATKTLAAYPSVISATGRSLA